jgi:hypothetical protein
MSALDDAAAMAIGDQRRELHVVNMSLLLGEMVRSIGMAIAEELQEFDREA